MEDSCTLSDAGNQAMAVTAQEPAAMKSDAKRGYFVSTGASQPGALKHYPHNSPDPDTAYSMQGKLFQRFPLTLTCLSGLLSHKSLVTQSKVRRPRRGC